MLFKTTFSSFKCKSFPPHVLYAKANKFLQGDFSSVNLMSIDGVTHVPGILQGPTDTKTGKAVLVLQKLMVWVKEKEMTKDHPWPFGWMFILACPQWKERLLRACGGGRGREEDREETAFSK